MATRIPTPHQSRLPLALAEPCAGLWSNGLGELCLMRLHRMETYSLMKLIGEPHKKHGDSKALSRTLLWHIPAPSSRLHAAIYRHSLLYGIAVTAATCTLRTILLLSLPPQRCAQGRQLCSEALCVGRILRRAQGSQASMLLMQADMVGRSESARSLLPLELLELP